MSQFCGSLGAFSSRSGVTSAATAGSAMAARLIDVNAASISLFDTAFLPFGERSEFQRRERWAWTCSHPPRPAAAFGGDRLTHLTARIGRALWKIAPPPLRQRACTGLGAPI